MNMKRCIRAAACLLLTLLAALPAPPAQAAAVTNVKVAVDCKLPPFQYVGDDGVLKGMHIDLMNEIARRGNLLVEYVVFERTMDAVDALVAGDEDAVLGALPVDISQTDAYYFSPQKAFGSDGGLWIAVLSPAAIERAYGIAKSVDLPGARRWIPPFLSLTSAIENSRKDQTLNTPAVATLIMLENQVRWLNDNGGLAWASARCARSASLLYQWAEKSDYASPFVNDRNARSNAVVTIDINDGINASQVVAALRENGIVDTNGYRKLGRNQLRIGVFPSVEPSDVDALTRCIDYVVEHL